nr:hypothetical protein [Mycobacterium persicum]
MSMVMTVTDVEVHDDDDASPPYWLCWDCGGPCLTFKGSVHGWRCQACIDRYLDVGAARWLAQARKEQDKLRAKLASAPDPTTSSTANTGSTPEGGQRYVPRPPASGQERAAVSSYVPRRPSDHHHHQEGTTG